MTNYDFLGARLLFASVIGSAALAAGGCMDEDEDEDEDGEDTGSDEEASSTVDPSVASASTETGETGETGETAGEPSAEEVFDARATGQWLLQFAVEGADGTAYVDDYDTFDGEQDRMTLHVEVFADEARTTLLLTYDAVFSYQVVGFSATIPDGFDIDIQNLEASMTAHVDPAIFIGFGLDDCGLVLDEAVDVSLSACGAPSFRDGSCLEMDIYQVAEGAEEMFPAAGLEDRCETRPTAADPNMPYRLIARDLP